LEPLIDPPGQPVPQIPGGPCRLRGMERRIDLPGCDNFRDLGGYPARAGTRLRWRRLFRSDALHGLTPEGADRVVDELGVGTIVDLRSTGEVGIARVITALAECSTPAVYHCTAGKDRTGLISAIVLGLLGVPDEFIVADYAASQESLDAIVGRLTQSEGYRDAIDRLPADTFHAEPETMFSLLDRLRDRYGSVRGYAREIGLSAALLGRLEGDLLEREPA
jgi:protein-tyrosine phosphatase